MFLSRIRLDICNRCTLLALGNPDLFHKAIESSFEGGRPNCLWRVDSQPSGTNLLVLSKENPVGLNAVSKRFGETSIVETKSYEKFLKTAIELGNGSKWRFRIKTNPSYRDNQTKKIVVHATVEHQKKWFIDKSEKNGFCVSDDSFEVVDKNFYRFKKSDSQKVSLLAVTFEGILEVTDPEKFYAVLTMGFGRSKTYGLGLMTLMKHQ